MARVLRAAPGVLTAAGMVACGAAERQGPTDRAGAGLDAPPVRSRGGYLLEIDAHRRAVRVAPPPGQSGQSGGPSFSILEGEAIGLTVSNITISEPGAYSTGKLRLRFDVAVANRLPGVALEPPALPGSDSVAASLMLFPLLESGDVANGSVATTDDGTVLVNRSAEPVVEASADWNGDGTLQRRQGFDFAGDTSCLNPAPGCTRWVALPPLAPGDTSPVRTVGFDLDPSVSTFRAWLLLAADLRIDSSIVSPPPPPPPPSTGAGGVPFGPFGSLRAGADPRMTEVFTLGHEANSPSSIIYTIVKARAQGTRLLLAMTGGPHSITNPGCCLSVIDGVLQFDRAKWNVTLQAFNTPAIREAIAAGVADGTILAAYVMDEPYVSGGGDGNTWGPRGTMTKARVDSLCGAVKQLFPSLPAGVVHQHQLFEPDQSYRTCDFVIDQYNAWMGSITAWRDAGLAMAQRDGYAVIFALNVMDGGIPDWDGAYDCPGTGGRGTYFPNCRMTAEQVRIWGIALGSGTCGLMLWQYNTEYMADPANQQAFQAVAAHLRELPSRSCTRS